MLVYRLDRISRSLADFVNILSTFKEYGVEFVSTQEAFDTSSPYGELIVKILAVFAEFERQSIISRVTQAYEHRSEMGFYMGGRRPYGYELEPVIINNINTKGCCAKAQQPFIVIFRFPLRQTFVQAGLREPLLLFFRLCV